MSHCDTPGFNVVQTRGDGHCLLYSIIGSWKNQIINIKPPSLHAIKCQIYTESINNADKYLAFLPQTTKSIFIKQLSDYITYKKYDTAFGDIAPMIISNSLSISITIINFQDDGSHHEILIVPDSAVSNIGIKIHRKRDHFSALRLALSTPIIRGLQPSQISLSSSRLPSSDPGVPHGQQSRPSEVHQGPTTLDHSSYLPDPLESISAETGPLNSEYGFHRQR